jgi:hypothetical protein
MPGGARSGNGGLVEVDVKSTAGRREIALPDQLFILLMEHRKVRKTRSGSTRDRSGMRAGGCSPSRPASRSIPGATSPHERTSSPRPGYVRRGCMTPGIPRPPSCCCSAFGKGL